jgi:predicted nucleic acid-binding protein
VILYLDTSSILAIHLKEPQRRDTVLSLIEPASAVATSRVSYAEARAGLALARREPRSQPRLSEQDYGLAVAGLNRDWDSFMRIDASEELVQSAGRLAELYNLRGYDSIQLASTIELSSRVPDEILFSTWDVVLSNAALSEGLSLAHEVTS